MHTWIALLRGVNVNGITVRSADLAALFRDLGFDHVTTVLASGNVRFDTDAAASARATLKHAIEAGLRDRFGYDAWIVLITLEELRSAIEGFAFDADDSARQPYVVFASEPAVIAELESATRDLDAEADPVAAAGEVLYWNPVKGTTVDTEFGKLLSKKSYRTTTTNRNLRTLIKIAR